MIINHKTILKCVPTHPEIQSFYYKKPDKENVKKKLRENLKQYYNKSYFSSVLHIYHKTTLAPPTFNLHPTQLKPIDQTDKT